MSSIWSNAGATAAAVSSPFATTGIAPSPGGGGATRFQSLLQSAQKAGQPGAQSPPSALSGAAVSGAAATADDASTSTGSAAGITANDFLTLLVTEMQNQDPTAQTDPNEYINQLTQINSLEQLISINQNLETVLGAAASPTTSSVPSNGVMGSFPDASGSAQGNSAMPGINPVSRGHSGIQSSSAMLQGSPTAGNLSMPAIAPASHVVAHALDGSARAASARHAIRDIPTH